MGIGNGSTKRWFFSSAVIVSTVALLLGTAGTAAAGPAAKTVYFDSAPNTTTEGYSGCVYVDRSVTKGKAPIVTVTITGGTATAGVDYTAGSTTVTFSKGSSQGYACVSTLVDGVPGEADETVTFTLSVDPASRGWTVGTPNTATLTIHEMAAPTAAPTALTAAVVSATADVPYVHLSWTPPTQYYGSYWIGKSTTSGGPYTQVATVTGISYDVTPAPTVDTYYVVAAVNADTARSTYTNEALGAAFVPGSGLYWVNGSSIGKIKTANLDGSGAHTLITGQTESFGIAVNATHVYWSNVGANTIMRANLDGSSPTAIVTGQSHPYGVALDADYVYWTNLQGQTIYRADLDGSNPTLLVDGTSYLQPAAIAVDANYLYFADVAGYGTINRAPLGGGDWAKLVDTGPYPFGIAVDGSHIYWTECGDNTAATGSVVQADLDGGNVTTLASNQAHPVGIAVDSSHIYWSNANTGAILSSNLSGGSVTTLVTGQSWLNGVAVAP